MTFGKYLFYVGRNTPDGGYFDYLAGTASSLVPLVAMWEKEHVEGRFLYGRIIDKMNTEVVTLRPCGISSEEERHLDTVKAGGSSPSSRTGFLQWMRGLLRGHAS